METARFEIKFVGEAVASGAIDVKYLAPTLLAVGDLIEESNRVLNGNRALVSVQLKADFQPGSFEGLLELGVSFLDQAKNLFAEGGLHDAKGILESIGFWGCSGVTLYRLIRKIGFRKQISEASLQGEQVSIGHCQRKVRRAEFSAGDRELGRSELTPLGECRDAVEREMVP